MKIKYDSQNEEIENFVKTFQLEERYQVHKEEVLEFLKHNVIYNEKRIDEIFDTLKKHDGKHLLKDKNSLKKIAFGNFYDEKNRILSKLKSDILDEFRIKYK